MPRREPEAAARVPRRRPRRRARGGLGRAVRRRRTAPSCSSCASVPRTTGRVIGRGGRTAHALRTVVKAAAAGEEPSCARRHRRLSRAARSRAASGPRAERAPVRRGHVGRAHGLDGSFYVTGARPRLLPLGASVEVAGRGAQIVRRAGTERRPIVRLRGRRGSRGGRGAARRPTDRPGRRGARSSARASGGRTNWRAAPSLDGAVGRSAASTRLIELPSARRSRCGRRAIARRCWCRWSETRSARIDAAAGRIEVDAGLPRPVPGERAAEGRAMELDVFTLFPEWFEWFARQRHVANVLAAGSRLESLGLREHTPLARRRRWTTRRSAAAPAWCLRVDVARQRRCGPATAIDPVELRAQRRVIALAPGGRAARRARSCASSRPSLR